MFGINISLERDIANAIVRNRLAAAQNMSAKEMGGYVQALSMAQFRLFEAEQRIRNRWPA